MGRKSSISFIQLLFPLLLALPFPFTLMNCARESAPLGGPVDSIAPYAVVEKPQNNSQNIYPQKIVVKFNEYIALDNIEDNCMISPIMSERPDISVKKKKMIIDLSKQHLQAGTTYSFNFSNAIKDLTESNVTDQYLYAFSTGTGIDSMKIAGSVLLAADGNVPEQAYILLYDNLSDTALQTTKPRYVTQISKKGEFSFSNIEAKPYRIYALIDSDKDFTFNQPTEKIAFLDTIFNPTAERFIDSVWFAHNDTIRLEQFKDSIQIVTIKDSFNLEEKTRWSDQNIRLSIFENEVWNQEVLSHKRISPYAVACKFAARNNFPSQITFSPSGTFSTEKISDDSLIVWFQDTTLQNCDSTKLFLQYNENKNSSKVILDTLIVEQTKDLPTRLMVSSPLQKDNKVYPGDSIYFTLSRPIQTKDLQRIVVYELCDSSKMRCDSIVPFTDYKFRPKNHYAEQKILKYKDANDRFALYFSKPIRPEDVVVTLDGLPNLTDWYYCEADEKSNALLYWIKPGTDALRLKNAAIIVEYKKLDGTTEKKNFNTKKDVAVTKMYKTASSNKKLILQIVEEQEKSLKIHEPIRIYCNNPIKAITDSLFTLIQVDDSLETSVITKITPITSRIVEIHHTASKSQNYTLTLSRGAIVDTFGIPSRELVKDIQTGNDEKEFVHTIPYSITNTDRTYAISADWKTNTTYKLVIPDSTFTDIFGDANDSTLFSFQSPKKEDVGNLVVKNTQGFPSENLVFVLQSAESKLKDAPLFEATKKSGIIRFENIPAGNYSLRCFVDENNNGKWDTGCIEIKRQPEKYYFFKDTVTIKAEWDNAIYWEEFK